MSQSRIGSFVEACANTATGFLVSMLAWQFVVAPTYGLPVDWSMNFQITAIFTVLSIARSYIWRRAFNWWGDICSLFTNNKCSNFAYKRSKKSYNTQRPKC